MPDSDPDEFINMRVPRAEYEKLKQLREKMKNTGKYSWAGSLALGAFIGLVAGLVIDEYLNKDEK